MITSFHRIITDDSLIIQGMLHAPETETKKAYLHIHGMAGNFYEDKMDELNHSLVLQGYAVLSLNTRGHDTFASFRVAEPGTKSRRIGNAYEKFEECVFDVKAGMDLLEKAGYDEIVLGGHSLGAHKVAYYFLETKDSRVQKLILMSPPDMAGSAEIENDHHAETLEQAKQMIVEGKGEELLLEEFFGGYYLCARTYVELNSHDYPIDIFNTYDPEKKSRLEEITVPTLAFLGEFDEAALVLPPLPALELMKRKAGEGKRFDICVIPGANHGYSGKEKEMTEVVVNWLCS